MAGRPVYETREHREAELELSKSVGEYFRCDLMKTPPFTHYDYLARRGDETIAIVECKVRYYTWYRLKEWGGYMIGKRKFDKLSTSSEKYGVPAMLVVKDKIGSIRACSWLGKDHPSAMKIKEGGRTDRNDRQDMEPCCIIPTFQFSWRIS